MQCRRGYPCGGIGGPQVMSDAPLVAGLFAGVGGIELGFQRQGFTTAGSARSTRQAARSCAISSTCRPIVFGEMSPPWLLPTVELRHRRVSLSGPQPGWNASLGSRVRSPASSTTYSDCSIRANMPSVLLENVSYMLRLDRGAAMSHLVSRFEERGYDWAYRVVDARSFGIPQRRQRVLFFASRDCDPLQFCTLTMLMIPTSTTPSETQTRRRRTGSTGPRGFACSGGPRMRCPLSRAGRGSNPSAPAVWIPRTGEVEPLRSKTQRGCRGSPLIGRFRRKQLASSGLAGISSGTLRACR